MSPWRGLGPALADARPGQRLHLFGRVQGRALVDATGAAPLDAGACGLDLGSVQHAVGEVQGRWNGRALVVDAHQLRPAAGPAALGAASGRIPAIAARFALVRALRQALQDRGYQEVTVPQTLEAAGTDPFIEPVPVRLAATWNPAAPTGDAWLHTSPELELKRLLALGFPAIYQLGPVFRQGDLSPLHEPEFLMAEWYRVGWSADDLAAEVGEVVVALLGGDRPPPAVHTVADLCARAVGVDVLALQQGDELARALGTPAEPFVHAFSRLWVDRVEPLLADMGAVLLTRWPAALGMLARLDPDDPRVALRFELVVDGLELANGFEELTDPAEQRRRFQADLDRRAADGLPAAPMPERFLRALDAGLPPCSGVALGVDRLAMLASGADSLAAQLASPAAERFG